MYWSEIEAFKEVEPIGVFEELPMFTRTHWRPLFDFLDELKPNNALIDVKINPLGSYKPTQRMIDNGYLDQNGLQHVFFSCLDGFEEGTNERRNFKVRKSPMMDIFAKAKNGDVELVSTWVESTLDKAQSGDINIDYLIYRYKSQALDYLPYLNGRVDKRVQDSRSEGVTSKASQLRTWLSKTKREIRNYHHYRDVGLGMLAEIWLCDILNSNLQRTSVDGYKFVIAPNELDASIPDESSGGDILLLKLEKDQNIPISLIDVKLQHSPRRVGPAGYNKRANCPKITFPIGMDFEVHGLPTNTRNCLFNLRRDIRQYSENNPLIMFNIDSKLEFNNLLLERLRSYITNAQHKFEMVTQTEEVRPELKKINVSQQMEKLNQLEELVWVMQGIN